MQTFLERSIIYDFMSDTSQEVRDDDRSLTGRIARDLAARIISGDLPPGHRLPQDQVAQNYRVSHVPVREAFQRLEAQGLGVIEPRRGVRVARLDPADVLEVAEMRAALETLALRHAMPRMGPEHLARAEAAMREGPSHAGPDGQEAADRRFHEAITAACAMPRLLAAIGSLHQASARHRYATLEGLGWQGQSDAEHAAIFEAIATGRAGMAGDFLPAHGLDAGRALAAALGAGRPGTAIS